MTEKEFYILNRETVETVVQGNPGSSVYPYLEIKAMNDVGEKVEGVYFYYYLGHIYAFRGK